MAFEGKLLGFSNIAVPLFFPPRRLASVPEVV